MSLHIELIRAVLLDTCRSDEKAQDVLQTALLREVDPLDYCAMTLGLGQAVVMQRCADWLQLAHVEAIPSGWSTIAPPQRLNALAEARTVRIRIMDRDVLFCSPGFFEVVRLRQRGLLPPAVSNRLCLVPHNALRDFLVRASSQALTDEARQRLARRWPFATAHLELTLRARIVFVAGLFATLALVLVSPFLEYPVLLPFVFLVLAIPAAIRLAGVFRSLTAKPAAPVMRPRDSNLPVYSVLIPLCDEAHMVPQLVGAMLNLDYPALCIKSTKTVRRRANDSIPSTVWGINRLCVI